MLGDRVFVVQFQSEVRITISVTSRCTGTPTSNVSVKKVGYAASSCYDLFKQMRKRERENLILLLIMYSSHCALLVRAFNFKKRDNY